MFNFGHQFQTGKNKPPEENVSKLPKVFTVFTHSEIFVNARKDLGQKLQTGAALQCFHEIQAG